MVCASKQTFFACFGTMSVVYFLANGECRRNLVPGSSRRCGVTAPISCLPLVQRSAACRWVSWLPPRMGEFCSLKEHDSTGCRLRRDRQCVRTNANAFGLLKNHVGNVSPAMKNSLPPTVTAVLVLARPKVKVVNAEHHRLSRPRDGPLIHSF